MRERLKSKLHRARVTRTDLDYDGSIAIDRALLAAADIDEYEKVQVVNVTNGERFWTYAIEGGRDEVSINGAAAHLAEPGDVVIVMAYGVYDDGHAPPPTVVLLDGDNHIVDVY